MNAGERTVAATGDDEPAPDDAVGYDDGLAGNGRRTARRLLLHAVPATVLLLLIAAGLVLAIADHWRRGSAVIAIAAALGGVMRLALPARSVGPLAVRSRAIDVVIFLALAALLGAMAFIPISGHP